MVSTTAITSNGIRFGEPVLLTDSDTFPSSALLHRIQLNEEQLNYSRCRVTVKLDIEDFIRKLERSRLNARLSKLRRI